MEAWETAVLEWVNCLDILDTNVNSLEELRDGRFFSKLIKILSEKEFEDDCDGEELVSRFIQESYPDFSGADGKGNVKIGQETYVASLLLLHASQEPKLHRPMCLKLSNETQLKIKSFLEKVLELGSSITRDDVTEAITETGEQIFVRTPPVTPKMRPLKDFFNSPATTVRKNYSRLMDERTRELRNLRAELETERFEKADLLEDLEIQRQKNNSLQMKLQEKIAEMKSIREETTRFETPQSSKKKKDVKTPRHRTGFKVQALTEEIGLLKSDICNLQEEKDSLARKLASAERQCLTFREKCKLNERNLETLLIQEDLKNREIEELKMHNDELRSHIQEMRRQTIAEQSFEMEMSMMSPSNSSLNGSEVLSSVIDIQLQEVKEEARVFKSQIEELRNNLDSIQREYRDLRQTNKTLEAEVSLLESTKNEYIETSNKLEQEKSHFQNETARLEEMLKQSEHRNEVFRLDVNELEDKLKTAKGLLSEERNKVRDLETVVSQKVESLNGEYARYQTLDQEHNELKQKKLDLMEERKNLKNLIASRDDSLMKAHQQRELLELALKKLESELEKVQALLSTEYNKVKELESTISQMKLEHDRTIEGQLAKYCSLEEKHGTLEQEKDRLLKEVENLNLRIVSCEKQMESSTERNEKLASELWDLNNNLQSTENSLAEERKRVEDLESAVTQIKTEKQELMESQLSKYQILGQERDELSRETKDLNLRIAAKENLLKESFEKNAKLTADLEDLTSNFKTTENALAEERKRVKDLEILVSQMKLEHETTLEVELSKFKTLDEKYINLEHEWDILSQDTEDLNLKIAKRENSLREALENSEHLMSDLRDVNEKLQIIEKALAQEKNKVEALESTISQIKLEYEKNLRVQFSKYQSLEEKYVNLEQERNCLSRETEDLHLKIASSENLLKESKEKNENLASDLQDLNNKFESVEKYLAKERNAVETLKSTISQVKLEHEKNLEVQFSKYQTLDEKYLSLEQQRVNLLQETGDLNLKIASCEILLKESVQKNENLASDLQDLSSKHETAESALADEKKRVEHLECTVARVNQEKEDTLRNQLMSYEALEQENTKLVTEVDRLTSLISSKEEQLQQLNDKFALDTCGLTRNLQTLQDSLNTEKTRVENLESRLYEANLKNEESLQKQVKKFENLKEMYLNLEQEKIGLFKATEHLNHKMKTSEDLLTESRQENENLTSELRARNDELKLLKDSLAGGKSRIKELESTIARETQEREQIIERQSMSYQSLEAKRLSVEHEKLDLLKDVDGLKNLVSATEKLLLQSQQYGERLKGDLCAAKDELKATMTKIESLESEVTEGKLETERIDRSNQDLHAEISALKSAKHDLSEVKKELDEQRKELEQEKLRLLGEIEELKTEVSSREDLLKQIEQRNEILDSRVNNLGEEVKSAQVLLTEKSARVKDLESTLAEMDSERKESLSIIEKLKLENVEHRILIQSCHSMLTKLVEYSSRLTGEEVTGVDDLSILDLSKELKTLINRLEVIYSSKDSELKQFQEMVSNMNSTVSKLQTDIINFEEMKVTDDQMISEYLKELNYLKVIAKEKESLVKDVSKLEEQLSEERSKIDSLNRGKTVLGQGLTDVKNSLILLKKEKLILVENVESQNRELLSKMASISKVIGEMQGRINLDDGVILQLREENSCLASEYEEEKRAKTELEKKCETLENDNKSHTKEKKELKEKLNAIRVRNAKLEKNLDELRKEVKKLEAEKVSDTEQSTVEELQSLISKLQNEIQELEADKMKLSKRPTETRLKEIHLEYDQKLEKIKQKMKTAYNEQILKVNKDQERLMQEKLNAQRVKMEELCRKHAEEMTKYKDHVTKLSSDYWDVGEKLLVEKQQKEHLAQQVQELRRQSQMYERNAAINNSSSQSLLSSRNKTASLDRREFGTSVREESSASQRMVETIKEEVTMGSRRESIQSVQTMQGMGNAFKVEDEEGEVFNTNYLADMKAGRCSLAPDIDRLSVLQMRNAQCKPHLKSSYPAETQFQPGTFTEEEIKSGSAIEDVFNDSLSQSLLPGEKTKKRDRTQTLYKRPGPPTPSKNGGRLSLQGNELKSPNSRILRERNVERRSTATPRRLKDIFGGSSKRQDENVSGTPKGRRLSSIFRKPK